MSKNTTPEPQWIPTGCDLLDLVLGGGSGHGVPSGKIINIVGDKSSGKTFVACEIISAAYRVFKDKLKWNYDDAEHGFTFNTLKLYGIDIEHPDWGNPYKSHTIEEMEYHYKKFLNQVASDEVGIYVVDSLDSISSEATEKRGEERYKSFENKKEFKAGSYQMDIPKYLSQEFFKRMTDLTSIRNTLLIIISQVRENIDPYSYGKFKRNGGKALDFYAYACLWLATNRKMEIKGRAIGVYVNAKTEKLKAPRPFRSCDFTLLFDYGLDNIGSNIDWLFDYRTEKGELRDKITSAWEETTGRKQNLKEVRSWLKEQKVWDDYLDSEEKGVKTTLAEVMIWINGYKPVAEKFCKEFGAQMTRDEMIKYVEDNNLQAKLTHRVQERWEEIEDSIRTERRPKYVD